MISHQQWVELGDFLRALGDPHGFSRQDSLREDLSRYLDLLLQKNQHVNLTAIRDQETAVWKHLADSLALAQWEPLGAVLDWGSGGGLPGIPLALARRSVEQRDPVFFVDSVGKKIRAVEEFGQALGLESCRFFHARGEELFSRPGFPQVETITMRAVAPAERAVEWLQPVVSRWVLLLGPQQRDLWAAEKAKVEKRGFCFGREAQYSLPHGQGDRVLLELVRK